MVRFSPNGIDSHIVQIVFSSPLDFHRRRVCAVCIQCASLRLLFSMIVIRMVVGMERMGKNWIRTHAQTQNTFLISTSIQEIIHSNKFQFEGFRLASFFSVCQIVEIAHAHAHTAKGNRRNMAKGALDYYYYVRMRTAYEQGKTSETKMLHSRRLLVNVAFDVSAISLPRLQFETH